VVSGVLEWYLFPGYGKDNVRFEIPAIVQINSKVVQCMTPSPCGVVNTVVTGISVQLAAIIF
jgi:hypothetical protein